MDRPGAVAPGRVGSASDGCEMRVDDKGEIHVRGLNVFPGYWGRGPQGEWLATGDLGDVDAELLRKSLLQRRLPALMSSLSGCR